MDHATALGYTAYAAGFSAELKLHRELLQLRVGGHDSLAGGSAAACAQSRCKCGNCRRNGRDIELLAYNAGGGDHYVIGAQPELPRRKPAHFFRYFNAVGIAGVGVAAVADDSLRLAVGKVPLGDDERRALDEVCRIYRRGVGLYLAENHSEVLFIVILAHAAVKAVCRKALCRTHAA